MRNLGKIVIGFFVLVGDSDPVDAQEIPQVPQGMPLVRMHQTQFVLWLQMLGDEMKEEKQDYPPPQEKAQKKNKGQKPNKKVRSGKGSRY